MTTITKEEVKAFIEQIESDLSNGWEAQIFELKLARIALASLDAEPIGAFHIADQQVGGTSDYIKDGEWPIDNGVIEVYAAPPAPVDNTFIPKNLDKALGVVGVALPESKEEFNFQIERWIQRLIDRVIRYADEFKEQPAPVVPDEMATSDDMNLYQKSFAQGYNACRTAMLQGSQPVSNHDELALYYLQGQKDGLEWAAQLAEANHPLTGDWLYDDPLELAKAIRKGPDMPGFAGSSPVTQDGWISCSERMPEDEQEVIVHNKLGYRYVSYFDEHSGLFFDMRGGNQMNCIEHLLVTHWRPMPAPPQEVK